jgi:hypothetical protein
MLREYLVGGFGLTALPEGWRLSQRVIEGRYPSRARGKTAAVAGPDPSGLPDLPGSVCFNRS